MVIWGSNGRLINPQNGVSAKWQLPCAPLRSHLGLIDTCKFPLFFGSGQLRIETIFLPSQLEAQKRLVEKATFCFVVFHVNPAPSWVPPTPSHPPLPAFAVWVPFGCGSKRMVCHFGVGEFTTHFRICFSGWIGMFTGG